MSDDKFTEIVSLLNDLEKSAQEVTVSRGTKLHTKPQYGPAIEIGATFSNAKPNKKFGDYEITADGLPASTGWIEEQMRKRILPGIIRQDQYAHAYSTPGDFRNEWNSAAALRTKSVTIVLREEDIPAFKSVLTQGIAELEADQGLLAANKKELKTKFMKDFMKSVVGAFDLTKDLAERTPNDLAKEAHVAYALSGNKTSRDQHNVRAGMEILKQAFAATDTKKIATEEDQQAWFAEGAVKFLEARKIGRTMQEMGLVPRA